MKLSEIEKEWVDDAEINKSDLASESLRIPKLHAKYYHIFLNEKKTLYALAEKKDKLEFVLESYFNKTMTTQERLDAGLPDFPDKRIMKSEVQKHIDNWDDMVELKIKMGLQRDKIDFLQDIIKQIHNRSFIIKDAIAWITFTHGQ